MIIIKIIILYFIQIRHTDDFPTTGKRLVGPIHYLVCVRLYIFFALYSVLSIIILLFIL